MHRFPLSPWRITLPLSFSLFGKRISLQSTCKTLCQGFFCFSQEWRRRWWFMDHLNISQITTSNYSHHHHTTRGLWAHRIDGNNFCQSHLSHGKNSLFSSVRACEAEATCDHKKTHSQNRSSRSTRLHFLLASVSGCILSLGGARTRQTKKSIAVCG